MKILLAAAVICFASFANAESSLSLFGGSKFEASNKGKVCVGGKGQGCKGGHYVKRKAQTKK